MYELPLNEWIVIFYPQTGATRLCPTMDFAKNFLKTSVLTNVYRNPNEFRVKHDHNFLEKCWRVAHKRHRDGTPSSAIGKIDDFDETPPDVGTEEFVRLLWDMLQAVGERLAKPNSEAPKVDSTATKENYELRLGAMNDLVANEEAFKEKYNNQALIVFRALLDHQKQFINQDEIRGIIYKLVASRALKTKQEPWTIFQYYRPQFIKDGFVVRGKKRAKKTRK